LTVLQRTPQYAFPAGNRPITPREMAEARAPRALGPRRDPRGA
jgi:hypothetical protein